MPRIFIFPGGLWFSDCPHGRDPPHRGGTFQVGWPAAKAAKAARPPVYADSKAVSALPSCWWQNRAKFAEKWKHPTSSNITDSHNTSGYYLELPRLQVI